VTFLPFSESKPRSAQTYRNRALRCFQLYRVDQKVGECVRLVTSLKGVNHFSIFQHCFISEYRHWGQVCRSCDSN